MPEVAPVRGAILGGVLAGALDISYAMIAAVFDDRSPVRAVQAIASGLLGADAFRGGTLTFALGLLLHFLILLAAAFIYLGLSRRYTFLRRRTLIAALLLGVAIYLVMHFLVVPLSAAPFRLPHTPVAVAIGLAVHVLLVGLPITAATRP